MLYVRNYASTSAKGYDFTRPIVSVVNGDSTTIDYDDDITLVKSGSITFTKKSTGSFTGSGYNFSYSYDVANHNYSPLSSDIIFQGCPNGKLGIRINGGDLIVGSFEYTHGSAVAWNYVFVSSELYYHFYYKESSGQGTGGATITFNVYTNLNIPLNSTINYEIYTG